MAKIRKKFSKLKQFFENRKKNCEKVSLRVTFFTDFVSLRVTFSAKFSLSKGQGSEVWHAHTQHPPTLVPPPGVCVCGFPCLDSAKGVSEFLGFIFFTDLCIVNQKSETHRVY